MIVRKPTAQLSTADNSICYTTNALVWVQFTSAQFDKFSNLEEEKVIAKLRVKFSMELWFMDNWKFSGTVGSFFLFAKQKNNIMNNAFRYVHKRMETTEEATIRNDNSTGRMKWKMVKCRNKLWNKTFSSFADKALRKTSKQPQQQVFPLFSFM